MPMNKSLAVLSRLLGLCRSRRPPLLPAVSQCYRHHFSAVLEHLSSRFINPVHVPRRYSRATTPRVPSRWYNDPWKVAAATALVTGGAAVAVNLKYRETVPFTGRTHLVVFSPKEARERDQAEFAKFKKEHVSNILGPHHPDTVRVRRIAHEIIAAAHVAFAIKQKATRRTLRHHGGLNWMDGLDWEVIVARDCPAHAECFAGAGKIIVDTELLEHFKTDAEIAVSIAHEVGHVIQRDRSSIMYSNWWLRILDAMPYLVLIMLPTLRRNEIDADYIGMLLLTAAGYDPRMAPLVWYKFAKMQRDSTTKMKILISHFDVHPPGRTRLDLLLEPKVMEEALDLQKQVVTSVFDGK